METGNQTRLSYFILQGFSQDSENQPILFFLFLSMYLITVLGNLLIILAITSDSHLHTPMYFFLCNLSLADICFTSTTIPKVLVNIQTQSKAITYAGCITQMCFFNIFGVMDTFLLTIMAYDRFVAICHPLHYTLIMNPHLCGLLVLMSWFISITYSLTQSLLTLRLSFCTNWEISHFFCELAQALTIACSDTLINHILIYMDYPSWHCSLLRDSFLLCSNFLLNPENPISMGNIKPFLPVGLTCPQFLYSMGQALVCISVLMHLPGGA
ncbi:hypothetical protein HJG60_012051 [Phyllostomus discolor]|uniref:Olfactory receptor n=1 Tax=Phyllostomus discolor TaxID=89673 RepID=A0A833ZQ29_9CHIR|nr:hypothetical protein HJG60_012051 [Phyllostomus discolor]